MTTTQHGNGTTAERQRHGKIETTETINAGEIAQRERWPDIVAFMLDEGMLLADQAYGWDDYCRLKFGMAGSGSSGEGWKQQEWIRFQKIIGYMHLRILHELWDWPVPRCGDGEEVDEIKWRLNVCMARVRNALSASAIAAQDASKDINAAMVAKNKSPNPGSL